MTKHHTISPTSDSKILRDIEPHAQPHLLKRPNLKASDNNNEAISTQTSSQSGQAVQELSFQEAFQKGLTEGKQQGFEEGMKQAQAEIEKAIQAAVEKNKKSQNEQWVQLDMLIKNLQAQVKAQLELAEEDAVALCFETLCRMLGQQAVNLKSIRAHIKQALVAWHGKAQLHIHLHPEDCALLQLAADHSDFEQSLTESKGFAIQWIADPKVNLGGCILRSSEGALDARLETQLQVLADALLQTRMRTAGRESA